VKYNVICERWEVKQINRTCGAKETLADIRLYDENRTDTRPSPPTTILLLLLLLWLSFNLRVIRDDGIIKVLALIGSDREVRSWHCCVMLVQVYITYLYLYLLSLSVLFVLCYDYQQCLVL
jgi:hypothetical protein